MSIQPYGVSRLRKALVHFITGRAVQGVARAILLLVLVRLLDVSDYGAYMLIVGLSEMMIRVFSFGILPTVQRFIPEMVTTLPAGKLYKFVVTMIIIQLVILCVATAVIYGYWLGLAPLFGFSASQIAATTVTGVLLFLLVPAFRFEGEILEALLEQGKAQLIRALRPIGRLIGIGVLLTSGLSIDLTTILTVDIVVTALCLLLGYAFLQNSLVSLHAPDGDGEIPVRKMIRFAWHMAAVDILGSTSTPGALRMVIANTLGVVESGLFAFLQSLQRLVSRYLPGTLLRGIVRPVLVSRAYLPGGKALVESATGLLLKSNLIFVAAGSVVVAVGGDELIAWASAGKFSDAGLVFLLLFLLLAFIAQRSVIEMIMQITGHTTILRATALIAPVALLTVWGLAGYGLVIAVLILAGAAAISNGIAMMFLLRSVGGFRLDWRGLLAIVLTAVTAIIAGMLLRFLEEPFIESIIALVLFAAILLIFRPYNAQELSLIKRSVGQRVAMLFQSFTSDRVW